MSDDPLANGGTSAACGGYQATGGGFYLIGGDSAGGAGTGGTPEGSWSFSWSTLAVYGGSRPVTTSGAGFASGGGAPGGGGAKPMGGASAVGGISGAGGVKPIGGVSSTGGSSSAGGMTHMDPITGTGGSSTVVDVCMMHEEPGNCDGYMPKYFFNPAHGQCEQFIYGGCGGNANRFDSLGECQKRCNVKSSLCPTDIPPSDWNWQCDISSVCYYQEETGCACRPEYINTNTACVALDAMCDDEGDASTPMWPDAGSSLDVGPAVVVCTCGSPAWTCRHLRMVNGFE